MYMTYYVRVVWGDWWREEGLKSFVASVPPLPSSCWWIWGESGKRTFCIFAALGGRHISPRSKVGSTGPGWVSVQLIKSTVGLPYLQFCIHGFTNHGSCTVSSVYIG